MSKPELLSPEELSALKTVRCWLASGAPKYAPSILDAPLTFSMATACRKVNCGTACCIGGAMALILGHDPDDYVSNAEGALGDLFFGGARPDPEFLHRDLRAITVEQALMAVDNFLASGDPNWERVLLPPLN